MTSRLQMIISVVLAGSLISGLSACSNPIGLPTQGAVQTMSPVDAPAKRVFTDPQGPGTDAQPESIVKGFFDAMPAGVQNDGYRVAKQFLTQTAAETWNGDSAATIYESRPSFIRKANTQQAPQSAKGSLIIETDLTIIGRLDSHGMFNPQHEDSVQLSFTLIRVDGQWRISNLPAGVIIAQSDFEQAYRQVSLYQLDSAGISFIPDVRWLSWRNWRTQAVKELLIGAPQWLGEAVQHTNTAEAKLAVESVPVENGTVKVKLSDVFNQIDEQNRALLVHQIRLTLGDGNSDFDIEIATDDSRSYTDADSNILTGIDQPAVPMYSLSAGHIVTLGSSSPLRIGQTSGFSTVQAFVYTKSSGAVLRNDNVVECLKTDGNSCGTLFGGKKVRSISEGLGNEIWAVSRDGRSLYVVRDDNTLTIPIAWTQDSPVSAIAVSPEGDRMALAVESGSKEGLVFTGVVRNADLLPTRLSDDVSQLSYQRGIRLLTFYNDVTLVYATLSDTNEPQRAWRQLAPGLPQIQKLPPNAITQLAAGQISMYRRLTVLDDTGVVRAVTGSLDGPWTIADSQVTAISNR